MSAPAEKPILFSTPLVRAILDGRKTETRRVVKPQPPGADHPLFAHDCSRPGLWMRPSDGVVLPVGPVGLMRQAMEGSFPRSGEWRCPYGKPGDLLWARETFAYEPDDRGDDEDTGYFPPPAEVLYRADGEDQGQTHWRPSIHMPKAAARIWLRVESIGVERVRQITSEAVFREGLRPCGWGRVLTTEGRRHHAGDFGEEATRAERDMIRNFARLWDTINAPRGFSWDANPFVWVVRFSVVSTDGRPA